ncbi:hypothetical protein D1007_36569 [Hordeum vulgare]|nr:hypothetical protein D1007_36569 [Hordeum vulgare]
MQFFSRLNLLQSSFIFATNVFYLLHLSSKKVAYMFGCNFSSSYFSLQSMFLLCYNCVNFFYNWHHFLLQPFTKKVAYTFVRVTTRVHRIVLLQPFFCFATTHHQLRFFVTTTLIFFCYNYIFVATMDENCCIITKFVASRE